MPAVTPSLALIIFAAGAVAGSMGALLGLGGGIFLVPFLNLGLGFPIAMAAAISLTTVIATSSSVTAGRAGMNLMNFRFGMLLEVATAGGSVLGGITAQFVAQTTLQRLFAFVTGAIAVVTIVRSKRRNIIIDPTVDPGRLGGRFFDAETGTTVVYQIKRLPLAVIVSFIAGNVSSLLGIGGGFMKVPVLNAWCGMPLRAAAATSAFMIGVTATGGAIIYYGSGQLQPVAAAAAILGVQAGSWLGLRASPNIPVRVLKLLLAAVLGSISVLMLTRGGR
jgi:uncharacterized membrane protein YfcA